jgi:threonine dehydrogenase-like Zn-dependent dehydrogenase
VTLAASSRQAEELAKAAGADHVVPFGKIKAHAVEQTGAREYKPALGDTLLMGGYDRIYDCLGTSVSMNASLRCVRTGGTISVVGISGSLALDPAPIYLKIPVIRGALYYGAAVWKGKKTHVFQIAIDLARAGKVRLDHLVTHKFPMDRYVEMIEVNRHKGRHNAVKTVMTFD